MKAPKRAQVRIGGRFNAPRKELRSFIRETYERYGARLVKVTWEGNGWFTATVSADFKNVRWMLASMRPEWSRL